MLALKNDTPAPSPLTKRLPLTQPCVASQFGAISAADRQLNDPAALPPGEIAAPELLVLAGVVYEPQIA